MADEAQEHKKAILENSKTLKELVKSMNALAKSQNESNESEEKGFVGNKVDRKIDDMVEAFNNNETVKFVKDPIGQLGSGIKTLTDPFTSGFKSLTDAIKKPFDTIGKVMGKGGDSKILKEIQKNTAKTAKALDVFTTAEGRRERAIAEAIGEGALKDELQTEEMKKLRRPLTNLTLITKQSGDALKSAILRRTGIDQLLEKTRNFLFGKSISNEEKMVENTDAIVYTNANGFTRLVDAISSITLGMPLFADNPRTSPLNAGSVPDPKATGRETAKALEASDAKKDQAERERNKDRINRENERSEALLGKLGGLGKIFSNFKGIAGKVGGGIGAWLSKTFGGAIAARVAGAGAVGGGLASFFKSIGGGFMFMARNLGMIARGAAAIALIGAAFIPFAAAVFTINKALEGMTWKKFGLFMAMLVGFGTAVAAFTAAIMAVGPLVFLGIAALGAMGVAMIPFGAALMLAAPGLEAASGLFNALSEVHWSTLFLAGPALAALTAGLAGLTGVGFIDKLFGGGDNAIEQLTEISTVADKITGISTAASAIEKLQKQLEEIAKISSPDESWIGWIDNLYDAVDKRDFSKRMEDARNGIGNVLGKITEHVNYNADRVDVMREMNDLILNSAGQGAFSSLNADSSIMESYNAGLRDAQRGNTGLGGNGGAVVQSFDNSDKSQNINSTIIKQNWHENQDTYMWLKGIGQYATP